MDKLEQSISELHQAILADIKAKERILEVNREKTKTHYNLLKAKERLSAIEQELSNG